VLDKSKINPKNIPNSKASLYYYTIKELLLKLKLAHPIITIDGHAGRQYAQEIRTYLRQSLREQGVKNSRIYLVDSRKNSLIQLTDIIAGAVARSYHQDKTDAKTYVKSLGSKITKIYKMKL
jgi:citrate lyase gamma subunit